MCGIFGIVGAPEASYQTYLGLQALQHRGQEGTGIVAVDGERYQAIRRAGLVREAFDDTALGILKGSSAIGHNRYSTTGASTLQNIQPFVMRTRLGMVAVSHNGNLVNAQDLIRSLEKQGSIFQSTTDTEVIVHLIAKHGKNLIDAVPHALRLVEGAYSLLILNQHHLIAVRDPHGFRPLVMGTMQDREHGDGIVFASESCAFDLIGADFIREVEPGEMIVVDLDTTTYKSYRPFAHSPKTRCVFEHVYFARPDSNLFGAGVYEVRKELGQRLAREQPAEGDMVIPVPDSGLPAAIGYSKESGIPFEMGLVRSHYTGRSFIQPVDRDLSVRLKLNAIPAIEGKDVIVIDDSLVRGTTSRKIISMLRETGAKKVHLRIAAPPTIAPCVYGIDTPNKDELLAGRYNTQEICELIGADSLGYLSIEGLLEVAGKYSGDGFCHACFSNVYPTERKEQ